MKTPSNLLSVTFNPQRGWHAQIQAQSDANCHSPPHCTITRYQVVIITFTDNTNVRTWRRVMNKWSRKCFGTDLIFSWGCARRCAGDALQPPTAASAKQCYIKSPCWATPSLDCTVYLGVMFIQLMFVRNKSTLFKYVWSDN